MSQGPKGTRIKGAALGGAILALGGAALATVRFENSPGIELFRRHPGLGIAVGGVLLFLGLVMLTSSLSPGRASAFGFRLNHFLPFLRRSRKDDPPQETGRMTAALLAIVPDSWRSDRKRAKARPPAQRP